jgi:hypothetical protein
MATVVEQDGFQVRVLNPPREHGPPHVHVVKGKGRGASEVLVNLGEPTRPGGPWTPISLREVRGRISDKDVVRAVDLVQDHLGALRKEWVKRHGTP